MSYNIKDNDKNFIEGIEFIQAKYPYYDKDKLEDIYSNRKYSIQMIENSLKGIIDMKDFYKIIIFDILIMESP